MGATNTWYQTTNDKRELDTSPLLPKEEKTRIRQFLGTLLYYARAVDPTMLVALGFIYDNQDKSNETTAQALTLSVELLSRPSICHYTLQVK